MFEGLIIYISVVFFFALLKLWRYICTENHNYDTNSLLLHVFILSYTLALVFTITRS